ncbi:hypothetical protein IE4872_CH04099 [Rhizobium gallicum]|uniref:Uncharacterized protein n=1 Tax=Rhizobium gallicum TaxID=56730 RepID=A0A1L5NP45_9HYPH|nr:hypothetical protein IE4872_CH04099 [Rhizobium gallicum]
MYEVMHYWDDDHPEWDAEQHAFAAAWRSQPKWVVSRSLKSVGSNATLVEDDLEGAIRELKAEKSVRKLPVPELSGSKRSGSFAPTSGPCWGCREGHLSTRRVRLSHGHPRDAMTLSRPPSIPLIAIGDVRGTDANWERFLASTSNSCLRSAVEWDATV